MNKLIEFCNAIKQFEGWYPGSRSWTNNSPGNLRWSRFQAGQRNGFAYFNTYDDGFNALLFDVKQKCLGNTRTGLTPESTILNFFNVWAPMLDGNMPMDYAKFVAEKIGFMPYNKLKEVYSEPQYIQKILCALINFQTEARKTEVRAGFEKIKDWFLLNGVPTEIEYRVDTVEEQLDLVETVGYAGPNNINVRAKIINPQFVHNYFENYINGHHFAVYCFHLPEPIQGLNPAEFNEAYKGAFVTQLPVLPASNPDWIAMFGSHELMHGWYFRLNAANSGVNLQDKVHSKVFYDPRREVTYASIIDELKPYLPIIFGKMSVEAIYKAQISLLQKVVNLLKQLIALVAVGRR